MCTGFKACQRITCTVNVTGFVMYIDMRDNYRVKFQIPAWNLYTLDSSKMSLNHIYFILTSINNEQFRKCKAAINTTSVVEERPAV